MCMPVHELVFVCLSVSVCLCESVCVCVRILCSCVINVY